MLRRYKILDLKKEDYARWSINSNKDLTSEVQFLSPRPQ